MSPTTEPPYRLGRAERRGTVVGFRPGQAAAVALGAAACVLCVGAGGAAGVAVAVVCLAAGVAVAAVPVRGRGIDEWAPVAAAFLVGRRRGSLAQAASILTVDGVACVRWPDEAATVVAELHHRGLRALADDPRGPGEAMAAWLRGLGTSASSSCTVALLTVTGPAPLVVDAPFVDPGARARAFVAVTAATPVRAAELLGTAGVAGLRLLDVAELATMLAARVAPAAGSMLDCDLHARWHMLCGPASAHCAFVVDEWPAGAVDDQVLTSICVSRDRRTVAISLRTEPLAVARSRTARTRTAAAANATLARDGGFMASAEASRDDQRDAERAAELAAGHGSLRMVGAVSLDAADAIELEAAAARLVADASGCGVRLRRCDGDHRRGVLATVPGWCVP